MWLDFNGQIIKEELAVISVFDHGFLYGIGLFETIRTYKRNPFLFHDHYERLIKGLSMFNIDYSHIREDDLKNRIDALLTKNNLGDGSIRISVSAGVAPTGLPNSTYESPNVIITCKPLSEALLRFEATPKVLRVSPIKRNSPEGEWRSKSFHFGNNVIAAQQMRLSPTEEGLFLTKEGYLAEGLVSNIFFVKGGRLYTPSLDTGILNGITRMFVMKLAIQLGVDVEEGYYLLSDICDATGVFVTNSVQEIVPISSIQHHWTQSGETVITDKLRTKYRAFTSRLLSMHEMGRE